MATNKVEVKTENGVETLMDLTGDTVTPETLAEGEKAHAADGALIVGTAKKVNIVQQIGTSETDVMSQAAATLEFVQLSKEVEALKDSESAGISPELTGALRTYFENVQIILPQLVYITENNAGSTLIQNAKDVVTVLSGGAEEPEATLLSISAMYRGGDVTAGTDLNSLVGITVIGTYSDGSASVITGYTLSGTIAEGINTITVSYEGLTTSFTVTGIVELLNANIVDFVSDLKIELYPNSEGEYYSPLFTRLSYAGRKVVVEKGKTYVVTPLYSTESHGLKYGVQYADKTLVDNGGTLVNTKTKIDSGWLTSESYTFTAQFDGYCWVCFANTTGVSITVDSSKVLGVNVRDINVSAEEIETLCQFTHDLAYGVTSDNQSFAIEKNSTYNAYLTVADGHSLTNVSVVMGGVDITSSVYNNGFITIPNVIDSVIITADAVFSGEDGTLLHNFDLTRGLTDDVGGVVVLTSSNGNDNKKPTQDANGLTINSNGQLCDFGEIYGLNLTYEMDITSHVATGGYSNYGRLFAVDTDATTAQGGSGFIFAGSKQDYTWKFYSYGSGWNGVYNEELKGGASNNYNEAFFDGKTLKLYVDSNSNVTVYAKEQGADDSTYVELGNTTSPFPSYRNGHIYMGSYNVDILYTTTITGLRVYGGVK